MIADENIDLFFSQSVQRIAVALAASVIVKMSLRQRVGASTSEHADAIGLVVILGVKEE